MPSQLMKWFSVSDKNYLKHIECLTLSCDVEYEGLWMYVVVLRLHPMVTMDELHEAFTIVKSYIANLMARFKDTSVREKWVKVSSPGNATGQFDKKMYHL
jgi:hypothetical protein